MEYLHRPTCSKSREGLALLQSHADLKPFNFSVRDYKKNPLNEEEYRHLLAKFRTVDECFKIEKIIRMADLKKHGLSPCQSESEWITLLSTHPDILQRPILSSDTKAVLGRPSQELLRLV